jgi:hypothetical protein
LATKCSSDWCLAETRPTGQARGLKAHGAVTAAIGATLLRSPGSSKPRQ